MAYVRLSTLSEGSIVYVPLNGGTYEKYVVAKHNYEGDLNSNNLTLLVSVDPIESYRYSNYSYTTVTWTDGGSYNLLRARLDSDSFQSRFLPRFLGDVKTATVHYNSHYVSAQTCNTKFFIPSATELGYNDAYWYLYIAGTEGGSALSSSVLSQINKSNTWTRTVYNLEVEETQTSVTGEEVTYYSYPYIVITDKSGTHGYETSLSNTHYYNLCFCLSGNAYVDNSNNRIYGDATPYLDVDCSGKFFSTASDVAFQCDVSTDIGLDVDLAVSVSNGSSSKKFGTYTITSGDYGIKSYTIPISDSFITSSPEGATFTATVTATCESKKVSHTFMFSVVDESPGRVFPYIGISDIAKKARRILFGVNNIARRVKHAYVGDANGIAKMWYSMYPKTVKTSLVACEISKWNNYAGAIVGKYALFAGGSLSDSYTSYALAFEKDTLTTVFADPLSSARSRCVGVSTPSYAWIASGGDGSSRYKSTFYYNSDLTKGSIDLSSNHVEGCGVRVGGYGLIAGGENSALLGTTYCVDAVEAVSDSVTKTSATSLPSERSASEGCTFNNYGIIVGGYKNKASGSATGRTDVMAYSSDLTYSTWTSLSVGRHSSGVGASKKILAVVGGGGDAKQTYELYDKDGTKIGSSYALYYGGYFWGGGIKNATDEYQDGLICFANATCTITIDGGDGTLVSVKSLNSSSTTDFEAQAGCTFDDQVIVPLLYSSEKVAWFRGTE